VGGGEQPRGTAARRAEVGVAHPHLWPGRALSGVQRHPGRQATPAEHAPILVAQRHLPVEGGGHGPRGAGESGAGPVPRRLEDHAPVPLHRLPQQPVVAAHRLLVGHRVRRRHAGAVLQIGEQEGDRSLATRQRSQTLSPSHERRSRLASVRTAGILVNRALEHRRATGDR
jgi:hypothetical protein